jgi:hypothetical protein
MGTRVFFILGLMLASPAFGQTTIDDMWGLGSSDSPLMAEEFDPSQGTRQSLDEPSVDRKVLKKGGMCLTPQNEDQIGGGVECGTVIQEKITLGGGEVLAFLGERPKTFNQISLAAGGSPGSRLVGQGQYAFVALDYTGAYHFGDAEKRNWGLAWGLYANYKPESGAHGAYYQEAGDANEFTVGPKIGLRYQNVRNKKNEHTLTLLTGPSLNADVFDGWNVWASYRLSHRVFDLLLRSDLYVLDDRYDNYYQHVEMTFPIVDALSLGFYGFTHEHKDFRKVINTLPTYGLGGAGIVEWNIAAHFPPRDNGQPVKPDTWTLRLEGGHSFGFGPILRAEMLLRF